MFFESYNENILNSTKNSKRKKRKKGSEISFLYWTKTTTLFCKICFIFEKKEKKVFVNVKSERQFLKVGFDSTEVFVELRVFPKSVMNFELLGLKTNW